jgi:hypothetical protein
LRNLENGKNKEDMSIPLFDTVGGNLENGKKKEYMSFSPLRVCFEEPEKWQEQKKTFEEP